MRALILSAGTGERLRPLTLKRAKPAIEFLNMPMLAFPYYWLDSVSLSDVVFNTHYLPETVRQAAMQVGLRPQRSTSHAAQINPGIPPSEISTVYSTDFVTAKPACCINAPSQDVSP